jgi:Tat protein secretion system quality control protein TatD with DNase activity
MRVLIDSHCHLDDSSFDADRLQVIDYAQQNGVQIQIIPAIDIFSSTHPHGNSAVIKSKR